MTEIEELRREIVALRQEIASLREAIYPTPRPMPVMRWPSLTPYPTNPMTPGWPLPQPATCVSSSARPRGGTDFGQAIGIGTSPLNDLC